MQFTVADVRDGSMLAKDEGNLTYEAKLRSARESLYARVIGALRQLQRKLERAAEMTVRRAFGSPAAPRGSLTKLRHPLRSSDL